MANFVFTKTDLDTLLPEFFKCEATLENFGLTESLYKDINDAFDNEWDSLLKNTFKFFLIWFTLSF